MLGASALLVAGVGACGRSGEPSPERGGLASAPARAAPAPASADPAPRRILALAPSVTEILFAIGAGPRVVGVDAFSDFPPEARRLPRLGGLVDPDLEGMLRLRPDLAVLLASQGELAASLRAAGVPTLSVPHERLEDVERGIRAIGARTGPARRAAALADSLRAVLGRARARTPAARRPRVLFVVAREPGQVAGLTAAGEGTYLDELVELAGGRNVLAGSPVRYPQVSAESVLRLQPDVILEWSPVRQGTPPHEVRDAEVRLAEDWAALRGLRAAAAGRVRVLHDDLWLRPGPRVVEALERLKEALAGVGARPAEALAG